MQIETLRSKTFLRKLIEAGKFFIFFFKMQTFAIIRDEHSDLIRSLNYAINWRKRRQSDALMDIRLF